MLKQAYYGYFLLFTAGSSRNTHNIFIVSGRFDEFPSFSLGNNRTPVLLGCYIVTASTINNRKCVRAGQVATFNANTERFDDPTVNSLIAQLAATTNVAKQHQIVDQLEAIAMQQVPVVALVSGAAWNEYQTNDYVGWPTAKNPYAAPGSLIILTHLRPAK